MFATAVRAETHTEDPAEVTSLSELAIILEPQQSLCYLPRRLEQVLQSEIASAVAAGLSFSCGLNVTAQVEDWEARCLEIHQLHAFPALRDDLALLLDIYATLLEPDAIGVRLQTLERPMCPRLHVDRVGIRLLCTYQGVGSQWLADPRADRSLLGTPSVDAWTHSPYLHTLPTGAIALLKGDAFPGNEGRGLIHRSPPTSEPRLLLSLDALWR